MANKSIYTVGGTVPPDSKLYVPRQADEDLLTLCRSGTFAYVLTSRQMGKSSLMVRTAKLLSEGGIHVVLIDLNEIGVDLTAEAWYFGLLTKIQDELDLEADVFGWWQAHQHLGVANRLTLFFREILLNEISEQVVIFVDEIDSTLGLDFTDDFYAAIRFLHNARSREPKFGRLSFVLIGVATPSELINNPKRTPFNVGQRINLTDFSLREARPFADGFGLRRHQGLQALAWALQWTGGHPYLTQRLCQLIAEQGKEYWNKAEVDQIVHANFFGEMSWQDHNLQFVRDTLTKRTPDLASAMSLYRAIRTGLYPVYDDEEQIAATANLKLSGVVRAINGVLHVRNSIYAAVFNEQWIDDVEAREEIADPNELARLRALAEAQEKQLEAERRQAEEQQRRTKAERQQTKEQQRRAEAERRQAIEQARADEQARAATKLRRRAVMLSGALTVTMVAVIIAILLGVQAQINAQDAQQAATQEALAKATAVADAARAIKAEATSHAQATAADIARATAQAEAFRALNAEATAQAAQGIAEGKSIEALDAEATAKAEQAIAQFEALRALDAEATAQAERAIAEGESLAALNAEATAQAEANRSSMAEATARAEQFRADLEAGRAREAERDAEDERATAQAESTRAIEAERTAQAEATRAIEAEQTAAAERAIAEAGATQEAIAKATAVAAQKTAEFEEERANQNEALATSRQLAAQAINLPDSQYDLALLLSLKASLITDTVEARQSLSTILQGKNQPTKFLREHADQVRSVAFSPVAPAGLDGQLLASSGLDREVILWNINADNPQEIGRLPVQHDNWVFSVAFSPDGQTLASGSCTNPCTQGEIRLWDIDAQNHGNSQINRTLTGHRSFVLSTAFSPDGQTLVSSSADGTIILWDVTTGQTRTTPLIGHNGVVWGVAITQTQDGELLLASGSADKTIRLWDVNTGQLLSTLTNHHTSDVTSVAFSPDGRTLASGSSDRTVKLWDVTNPADPKLRRTIAGHDTSVFSIAFSSDGRRLASGSADKKIILWDVANVDEPSQIAQLLGGHTDFVTSVAFSADGRFLASGSEDKTVVAWDLERRSHLIRSLVNTTGSVNSVVFNRDIPIDTAEQTLISGGFEGDIRLWAISNSDPSLKAIGQPVTAHAAEVTSLALANQAGQPLLASSSCGEFAPDGNCQLGQIKLWSFSGDTLTELGTTPSHNNFINNIAFSPNGQRLASGSMDSDIILWTVTDNLTLEQTSVFTKLRASVKSIAFNSTGQTLATGSNDFSSLSRNETLILLGLNQNNLQQLNTLGEHTNFVNSVAFTTLENQQILASGSSDLTAILWNVTESGQAEVRDKLIGHSGPIRTVAFSTDGQLVASGSTDKTIILWDVTTGQQLATLSGHEDDVRSLSFTTLGGRRVLASGGEEGAIILWDADFKSWEEIACNIANRSRLTEAEEQQYIPENFRSDEEICSGFPAPASIVASEAPNLPEPNVEPTLTATATPIPVPTPTATPTATATPTSTPTPTATPAAPASSTPTATPSLTTTSTPTPSPSAAATSTLSTEITIPEDTPSTPTLAPSFTATVTPMPTPTLTATLTATPTATEPSS